MAAEAAGRSAAPMTHREILEALLGLLMAMFVAMLSGTVVTNALPRIVSDLDGSQTGYSWVIVAALLAMTATTPIWGKLADLFDKKMLIQVALVVFLLGSVLAGLSQNMAMLISARVVTGLGMGGLIALVQTIIGSMVSPRERGRYAGYIGVSFALATVSGPLVGGVVVDSPLGWRGCFFVGLPVAVVAFIVLRSKLHLPKVTREVSIDYLGAVLIMSGVSLLLIWVSLAGAQFDWASVTTALMLAAAAVLLAAAIFVEAKVATEPIVPLELFRDRTVTLATLASVFVGIALFGATVYMSEYFQYSHGMSPTGAGLMSLFMVLGLMTSGLVSGRMITKTGYWKGWIVGGMATAVLGTLLLSFIDANTSIWVVGAFMAVLGIGVGATQQNLLVAVQNNIEQRNIGAATSVVTFFRSMGGSFGVAVLGALLGNRVADGIGDELPALIRSGQVTPDEARVLTESSLPDLDSLSPPLRQLFEQSFGDATGHMFLISSAAAAAALVCVMLIKEVPLRTTLDDAEPVPNTEPDQVRSRMGETPRS